MEKFYDDLKQTVVKMIKKEIDIPVLVSPIETTNKDKNKQYPKLLFKSYDLDSYTRFNVINYDIYDKYNREEIPIFDYSVIGLYILCCGKEYKIVGYSKGILEIDAPILNLSEYNDEIIIKEEGINIQDSKDYILVTCPYNYDRTMNANTITNFRRFQLDIYIYNDISEDKIIYYSKILNKLFARDFQIIDKNNKKIKGQIAYIYSQLTFDVTEYNITNKILRGSMLIKTYNG